MSKLKLTNAQYLIAMQNLRAFVESGAQLSGFDDCTIGAKDTQCTWGLCGDNVKVYPFSTMHIFSEQFPQRLSPKHREQHHRCPFENPNGKDQTSGCFHRCRFFLEGQRPNKAGWLQWFDEALALSRITLEKDL